MARATLREVANKAGVHPATASRALNAATASMVKLDAMENPFRLPQPLRPPLKWAGGKRWLVPTLRRLWQLRQRRRW